MDVVESLLVKIEWWNAAKFFVRDKHFLVKTNRTPISSNFSKKDFFFSDFTEMWFGNLRLENAYNKLFFMGIFHKTFVEVCIYMSKTWKSAQEYRNFFLDV
jgi:hypothetical protein